MALTGVGRLVPGVRTLAGCRRAWLPHDLMAGLVLTAVLVPVGMGYGQAAGLPPITGLYATIVPLVAYALVGPSRVTVLGPDSSLAAVIAAIVVGQLPELLGFSVDSHGLLPEARDLVRGVATGEVNLASLAVGGAGLAVILGLRRLRPAFPGVIVAVALGDLPYLLGGAVGIALVAVADTTVLSQSLGARERAAVDPNQELAALGTANLASGLFNGFPISSSASRTPVAVAAGARTQLTPVIGAAARRLYRMRRQEFLLWLAALLGVLAGVGLAIVLSLGDFVRRAWRPHDALLGREDELKGYHDLERHPRARQVPGLLLYRFDAPLFFANGAHFGRRVRQLVAAAEAPVRWVDAYVDATGVAWGDWEERQAGRKGRMRRIR